jgi:hypothetical protein
MKTYMAHLSSSSPYSQSKHHSADRLDKEGHDAYEKRTWRSRMHVDANGEVFIPPMAIKNTLSDAAKFLSMPVKGRGKSTYTKHIEAGILCVQPVLLGIKAADVPGEALFLPASGKRGDGKRVERIYPLITPWSGQAKIIVMDETVTKAVLEEHLKTAGQLIGIGRFRPRNNGYYGRFNLLRLDEVAND